ncbi:MAG TPA: glycosyltransferase family 2 protein [Kofleriaceae bacterium]|nr:glycosyltransferase family 2 protein [Kofleriaceae bacterium]
MLLIIPAYNEQASLGGLLAEIRAVSLPVELATVVVDDGSADRTAEIAREGGARVLRLCGNVGIGGAVQSGIRLARREGFDCAIQIDGDGQHPPSELPRLLEATANADLVVGTRYREPGDNFRSTPLRRLGSWWLKLILRVIARVRVSDPTSGYRLYGKRALALFDDTYPYDFPEPESLAVARVSGLSITEVPVKMRERQGGSSSIVGFSTIYYMLKVTVAIVLTYFRTRRRVT